MSDYYPPTYYQTHFHCPHCQVNSQQGWCVLEYESTTAKSPLHSSTCHHCHLRCFRYDERMIIPGDAPVPPHHPDLPESCVVDYDEARDVVARSPRAAAALLRLCIQKLMAELGQPGKNINDDIGSLVKDGLPVLVQQALDFCRVVGNNAVHPGEIDLNATPEIATTLFKMVNFIVEQRITTPKKIDEIYSDLPAGARDAIEKRDST